MIKSQKLVCKVPKVFKSNIKCLDLQFQLVYTTYLRYLNRLLSLILSEINGRTFGFLDKGWQIRIVHKDSMKKAQYNKLYVQL